MNTVTVVRLLQDIADQKLELDVCNIAPDVEKRLSLQAGLTLLKKTSASPSEVLFGELILRGALGEGEQLPIAVKVFFNKGYNAADIGGLMYETKVYKKILDEIVSKNYSPNFSPFVAYGECSVQRLLDMASPEAKKSLEHISQYSTEKINILITEKAGSGMAFNMPNISYPVTDLGTRLLNVSTESTFKILFQIIYSIEVMHRYRIVHNDLHPGNILVVTFPEDITMRFNLGMKSFIIKTKYIPYIFDWDTSYAESLGPNPKLEGKLCSLYNICNHFSRYADLYILLCGLSLMGLNNKIINSYASSKIMDMTESEYPLKISDASVAKIKKYQPYLGTNIYKFGKAQFREIIEESTEEDTKEINDIYKNIATSITFSLHETPQHMFVFPSGQFLYITDKEYKRMQGAAVAGKSYKTETVNKMFEKVKINKEIPAAIPQVMFTELQPPNILLYKPLPCRLITGDVNFPTPIELLTEMFEKYEIQPEQRDEKFPFVYTLPSPDVEVRKGVKRRSRPIATEIRAAKQIKSDEGEDITITE